MPIVLFVVPETARFFNADTQGTVRPVCMLLFARGTISSAICVPQQRPAASQWPACPLGQLCITLSDDGAGMSSTIWVVQTPQHDC